VLSGSAALSASIRPFTASTSASFSGPRFEPDDAAPLYARRRRREPAPEVLRIVERLADQREPTACRPSR
jgi:hypothetical protein